MECTRPATPMTMVIRYASKPDQSSRVVYARLEKARRESIHFPDMSPVRLCDGTAVVARQG
jgi:hypothetical protein